MAATCDQGFEGTIDSMLLEPLPPAKWNPLRLHLRDCSPCRERYNRIALAERMLHGGPKSLETPSPASFDRIGAAVLDASRPRGLAAVPRWAFSLFAIGVTAALLPFFLKTSLVPTGHLKDPEFAIRGTATDPAGQAGLRAFCLKGPSSEVHALDPASTPPQCASTDLLKLAYSNKAGYEDLFLVGLDADLNVKWYEPHPPSAISVPAQRGVDQPIGGAIKVGVNHDPGPVRIFALFAHAPIAAREIESAVDEMKRKHASIKDASTLPLGDREDIVQRSLLIEVSKSH